HRAIVDVDAGDQGAVEAGGRDGLLCAGDVDVGDIDVFKMRSALFGAYLVEHYLPVGGDRIGVIACGQGRVAVGGVPVHGEEDSVADAVHGDVLNVDVFYRSAAGGGRLDVKA